MFTRDQSSQICFFLTHTPLKLELRTNTYLGLRSLYCFLSAMYLQNGLVGLTHQGRRWGWGWWRGGRERRRCKFFCKYYHKIALQPRFSRQITCQKEVEVDLISEKDLYKCNVDARTTVNRNQPTQHQPNPSITDTPKQSYTAPLRLSTLLQFITTQ